MENNNRDSYTIDLKHIFKFLWYRAWMIILVGILVAGIGFAFSTFMIKPTYSSSIMLYVNNANKGDQFNISQGDINSSKELIKTYGEILNNRTTLERVIQKAGLKYDYERLSNMIASGPSNDTQVMKVTVTSTDPNEAAEIANCICSVLPVRIEEIIDGASMEVVEYAIPNPSKVGPSITRYTVLGGIIGVFIMAAILAVFAIMDDTIHDDNYITQSYKYPILAKIPDLVYTSSKQYGYYTQKHTEAEKK